MSDKISFVTPVGELKFPRLNQPDTKFNPAGEYNARILLSEADAEKIMEQLQALHDESVGDARKKYDALPALAKKKRAFTESAYISEAYDRDGNPDGRYELVFKTKASGRDARTGETWTRRPPIFDAQGQMMRNVPEIWSGTKARISFTVMPYYISSTCTAGIALKLEAVQVIELVSGSGATKSGSAFGFGAVDGGYKHDDKAAAFDEPEHELEQEVEQDQGDGGYDF